MECGDLAGKLVQARLDIKHSYDLYNSLSDWFKMFRSEHEGCARRLEASESPKKDSALVYAETLNVKRAQEKEKLGKGLAEEQSEEDLLELMGRLEGFDVHSDTKMKVEYDKLFKRQYPYVEKISRGFRHSVSDLLK
ncbi:hypothetical protein Tco_0135542, partial [Tanacetum coccineum]